MWASGRPQARSNDGCGTARSRYLRRDSRKSFCIHHHLVDDRFGCAGVAIFMTHVSLELDRVACHQHVIRAADYHFE